MNFNKIVVKQNKVVNLPEGKEISYQIDFCDRSEKLWFRIHGANSEAIEANCNPALVAMLVPAMCLGHDIEVIGEVSKLLVTHLSEDVQDLLHFYEPSWNKVSILAHAVTDKVCFHSKGCGTGFSAGIDSFLTLEKYSSVRRNSLSVTHVFNFDVGAMGEYQENHEDESQAFLAFEKYKKRLELYAEDQKLNSFSVSSNLDSFYKQLGLDFQKTHTVRNVSAALLFEEFLSSYLYSSTVSPEDIAVKPAYDMSYMDPVILPLLSTETLRFYSSGMSLSRFEKTKCVAEFSPSFSMLDVCVNQKKNYSKYKNCTKCWKCARTIMDLEVLDKLENYKDVFDIDYYYKHKGLMQRMVIIQAIMGSPIDKSTVDRSKANGLLDKYLINSFLARAYALRSRTIQYLK